MLAQFIRNHKKTGKAHDNVTSEDGKAQLKKNVHHIEGSS